MNNELPLNSRDLENFRRSFIDDEVIARAKIYRVDNDEGARLVGRRPSVNEDYSGIIFPYFFPDLPGIREYRLRRDNPDFELKEGEIKEKRKYLSPPGKSNMIYFPPNSVGLWLDDRTTPIVITEGEKKALALDRVAWDGLGDAAEKPRFLALGLSGVWSFRGTIGKAINANGHRKPVKGIITDFRLLALDGRKVTILYDTNVVTNEKCANSTG